MLIALDETANKILATTAIRGNKYKCPACKESLIYKNGRLVVAHFAHKAHSDCLLSVFPRTQRDYEMQLQVAKLLKHFLPDAIVEHEVFFKDARFSQEKHFADILVTIPNKFKFVIECQSSPIALDRWQARTFDYNKLNLGVLWIWDYKNRLGGKTTFAEQRNKYFPEDDEFRISKEVLNCHKIASGKVYSLDNLGELESIHLIELTRFVDFKNPDVDLDYDYSPKTLRSMSFGNITFLNPIGKWNKSGLKLMELGEPQWW